jgi:hypothetical protein
MEDIEITLHNSSLSENYLTKYQQSQFMDAIDDYKDSLRSLMKNSKDKKNLNSDFIIDFPANVNFRITA